MYVDETDLEFSCSRASKGGQHVGFYSGVTVTHIPSGIVVTVECERSQFKNKQVAIAAIEGALTSPYYKGR